MAHDVFLSYASADRNIADAICSRLEGQGIRCWVAPRNILPGTQWSASIIDAIGDARIMVIIFSSHSNGSPHVRNEVERAVGKNLHIIPFRIEDVPPSKDIELFVSSPHWLDAITPPVERHIDQLAETIRVVLDHQKGQGPPRPPVPPALPPARPRPLRKWAIAVVLVALAAAGLAAHFLLGGPSAVEVARTSAEVDVLHRETLALNTGHESVRRCLDLARTARGQAQAHLARGELKAAAELLATARENYEEATALNRAGALAREAQAKAEIAARSQTWTASPRVTERVGEARRLEQGAVDLLAQGEFDAARRGFESAAAAYDATARVNAEVRTAEEARNLFGEALANRPKSGLKPVLDAFARCEEAGRKAGASFDQGDFEGAQRLWAEAANALAELRARDDDAVKLEQARDVAAQLLPQGGEGWYLPLRPEVAKLREDLAAAVALLDREETWGEARIRFKAVREHIDSLSKRNAEAAQRARDLLASLAGLPAALAGRFPDDARRDSELVLAAKEALERGDFDEVAAKVEAARGLRTEIAKRDAVLRGRTEQKLQEWEEAWAKRPQPLYVRLAARSESLAASTDGARAFMDKLDYESASRTLEEAHRELVALAADHEAAKQRARKAGAEWQAYRDALPAGLSPPEKALESVRAAETAFEAADYDGSIARYQDARRTTEGAVAEWERTKEIQPGAVWCGIMRKLSNGEKAADLTLVIKTRDGGNLTGSLVAKGKGIDVDQAWTGTLAATQLSLKLVRDRKGDQGGKLDGKLEGTGIRGEFNLAGHPFTIELSKQP